MRRVNAAGLFIIVAVVLVSCGGSAGDSLAGTYIGYSWHGESKGETFDEATQKIQTILTVDDEGVITEASMLFWKQAGGTWYTRQDSTAWITVDLSVNPAAATLGDNFKQGTSMFNVNTHDQMALYAVAVGADGTAAILITEPVTRYRFEAKFGPGYDFDTAIGDLPVDGTPGGFIPTYRASSGGLMKPANWSELSSKGIFSISPYDHVMVDRGTFKGLNESSTVGDMLEAAGVTFSGGVPQEMSVAYGRHSNGGWQGNYEQIQAFLIGKNVNELTSLVDWSVERWANAVNDENFFGVDVTSGATKTVQNSADGISGATVRMSRESTSYQRALVAAGVLSEDDVIKGRF